LKKKLLIISIFSRLKSLLPKRFQKEGFAAMGMLLVNSILELAGVGVLIPIFLVILQEDAFESGKLKMIYEFSGISSENKFVMFLCIMVFVFVVLKNIASLGISFYQSKYAFRLYQHFSSQLQKYFYQKGFIYFKSANSNHIVRDVNQVSFVFAQGLVLPLLSFLTEIFILIVIVCILLWFYPAVIGILALMVMPVFVFFYNSVKNKIANMAEEAHVLSAETGKTLFQSIFGYVDVNVNNTQDYFFKSYKENTRDMSNLRAKQYVFNLMPTKVIESAMIMSILTVVLYGFFDLGREELVILLGFLAIAVFRISPSINRMMVALMNLKTYEYSLDVMEYVKDLKEEKVIKKPLDFKKDIAFNNLSFTYPGSEEKVLKDINFTVKKGESIGIIGRSGSGKTTLINILLGFLPVEDGGLKIDNVPLDEEHLYAWRNYIGYVQQEVFLLDGTIAENIAMGYPNVDEKKLNEVIEKASLKELVDRLPLHANTQVGERGALLSGGQKQRVGIARALYSGASVLLFDEATSALDQQTENEITEAINRLVEENLTMLIIAHRYSTLKYCDRIIELKNGEISNTGTYQELAKYVKSENQ
jgi:ABC-type bacteriocin/lantibiotic exporter with double-glycine peptidase domain